MTVLFDWLMTIHPHVLATVAAVFAILAGSTVFARFLRRVKPHVNLDEVDLRIRTWWAIAGIFVTAVVVNPTVAVGFFAFLSFLAFKEFLSLIPTRRADRRVLFWAYLSIPVQYYWVVSGWYGMFIVFVPVYMLLFLPMRMILIGDTNGFLRAAGTLHWGLMMTVFCISHVAFFMQVDTALNPNGGGAALVLFLVILTQFNDVAQFVWGKTIGRTKVVPTVSPGKTYGGLLGGLVTTMAIAIPLGAFLTPFTLEQSLQAGALIGMSGFVGDVVISALKRDLGIKDSGTMLPGHGGILDRLDSLLYTAPLFFHFTRYLDFVP